MTVIKSYMGISNFHQDAIDYVQITESMPLCICSEIFDATEGYEVPDKNKPIAYVISPEQFDRVRYLLERSDK